MAWCKGMECWRNQGKEAKLRELSPSRENCLYGLARNLGLLNLDFNLNSKVEISAFCPKLGDVYCADFEK